MLSRYWHLSQFYLFYFASLGALVPYWSLYLNHLSFSALEIGQLMSTLAVSKVVAPYMWGWMADKTGFHIRIVQIASLLSVLCFLPLLWFDSFWTMMCFMLLFSFFWNASLPQFEVVTMAQLGEDNHRYSQVRLWGSLGFIITATILGGVFLYLPITTLPIVLVILFGLIFIASMQVSEYRQKQITDDHIWKVLKKPAVLALLLSCFLMQLSHGPYYTFYSLHMESLDYSRFSVGMLWSLGVLAEVVLFVFMHRLLKLRPANVWLVISLLLTAIRWVLMAWFLDHLVIVIFTQCLHAASFGMFHAAAIHLIHDYFPQHRGRGQALYSSVSFGAGGALGSLYSGVMWESFAPSTTFMISALIATMGMLVAFKVTNPKLEG